MRERINRLANGIVDMAIPIVSCEWERIELPIKADEVVRMDMMVTSMNGVHLKGLAYTDHTRVSIVNASFGGIKNRIYFDVNSMYLKKNAKIRGHIHLVTNGGEKTIPFVFTISSGKTYETLSNLQTARDFAVIAKEDMETALRIFEYKDYVLAPFMDTLSYRKLYESLSHRANRRNGLEQFLIATGAKEPVSFDTSYTEKNYYVDPHTLVQDQSIILTQKNWGCMSILVSTQASFIELYTTQIDSRDFIENTYTFSFKILTDRLHAGKNTAHIYFVSANETKEVTLHIETSSEDAYIRDKHIYFKKVMAMYLRTRLEYEYTEDIPIKHALLRTMLEKLEKAGLYQEEKYRIDILKAESYILLGERERALGLCDGFRNEIKSNRYELRVEYLLSEYVDSLLDETGMKSISLLRLLKKFLEEEREEIFFLPIMYLDKEMQAEPAVKLGFLRNEFEAGNRSPFLFMEHIRLLGIHTEFLHELGCFELMSLWYGLKHHLVSKELMQVAAHRAKNFRFQSKLFFPLLKVLYTHLEDQTLLEVICTLLIQGNVRDTDANIWYKKGIDAGLALTKLNEYYMYSLGDRDVSPLPESILKYFLTNSILEETGRVRLYENILVYQGRGSDIYQKYLPKIKSFATDQAMKLRVDSHMIEIYKHVFSEDIVDERLAKVLPFILNSYHIKTDRTLFTSAVVIYPKLKTDRAYILEKGACFIPLYSKDAIILFADAYGNRYFPKHIYKQKMLHMPALLTHIYTICPTHDMLHLERLDEIETREVCKEDIGLIENALIQMDLNEEYKIHLQEKLLAYYRNESEIRSENLNWEALDYAFIKSIHPSSLRVDARYNLCDLLINTGHIKDAYTIIKEYGVGDIDSDKLVSFVSKLILEKYFEKDMILLSIAYHLFSIQKADTAIIDYLCEYFNGNTKQMFTLLKVAIERGIETYDMEERLLAQMLFTGEDAHIDTVFAWYMSRKKGNDLLIKAYFTMKSFSYFVNDADCDVRVFAYVKQLLTDSANLKQIPDIYKLSLSKYFSTLEVLDDTEERLAKSLVDHLLANGYLFPYFKAYAKKFTLPSEVLEREILEYKAHAGRVILYSKVLPDDTDYYLEEFSPMYVNIYVKTKMLFEDETWEYEIYEEDGTSKELKESGSRGGIAVEGIDYARFDMLNEIGKLLQTGKESELKSKMEDYAFKGQLSKDLFTIKDL